MAGVFFASGKRCLPLAVTAGLRVHRLGLLAQVVGGVVGEDVGLAAGLVFLQDQVAGIVPASALGRGRLAVLARLLLLDDDPGLAILVGEVGGSEALVAIIDELAHKLDVVTLLEDLPAM